MKTIFFLFASLVFTLNVYSQTERTPISVSSSSDDIACSDFNISVGIIIVNISTTVYICCGGPFMISPQTPSSIVPKRVYDLFTGQHKISPGSGILVSDLLSDTNGAYKDAKYLEIKSSSEGKVNGRAARIKKGRYDIDSKGMVYLEFEYL